MAETESQEPVSNATPDTPDTPAPQPLPYDPHFGTTGDMFRDDDQFRPATGDGK